MQSVAALLFHIHPRRLRKFADPLGLRAPEDIEVLSRTADNVDAELRQLVADLGRLHDLRQFRADLRQD